jgi:hypothetical protein
VRWRRREWKEVLFLEREDCRKSEGNEDRGIQPDEIVLVLQNERTPTCSLASGL